jgi:hypothetical protein
MTVELVVAILGWCTLINFGLLIWWFLFAVIAHDWTYRLHTKWFKISQEQFDAIHYSLMGVFKIGVITFNLVPYLALRIVA